MLLSWSAGPARASFSREGKTRGKGCEIKTRKEHPTYLERVDDAVLFGEMQDERSDLCCLCVCGKMLECCCFFFCVDGVDINLKKKMRAMPAGVCVGRLMMNETKYKL